MRGLSEIALTTRLSLFSDRQAFEQLVRKNQEPLRRLFLHLTLGDKMLSDDLAQETFIKAWTRIGQFSGRSSFQTWLFSIGYRTFIDYMRSLKQYEDFDAELEIETTDHDVGLKLDILQALGRLKAIERTCVTLQIIEGMQTDAIAQVTELNASTVRSHIMHGKKKLAEYLKENGYG